jgi:hypothetical protein
MVEVRISAAHAHSLRGEVLAQDELARLAAPQAA